MAEETDDEDRSLPASPRRLEQAREEGRIARSRELSASLVLIASAGALWASAPTSGAALTALLRDGLSFDHASVLDAAWMAARLRSAALEGAVVAAPWLLTTMLAALAGGLAVGGWSLSMTPCTPDFNRVNPVQGFSRLFSTTALTELGKALLKSTVVGIATGAVLWNARDQLTGLGLLTPESGLAATMQLLAMSLVMIAGSTLLIAAVDVPVQTWLHAKSLRMSLEELKREMRESEGDPHIKARIRSQQREMARRRMMADVPKADVVITNPTHYAVALAYQAGERAPRVVAKGQNLIAQRIREVAAEARVPLLEAPPLARALYRHAEIGAEIPWQLYEAVAQVLAWVMQVRATLAQHRPGHTAPRAPLASDLPVPSDWGAADPA